MSKGEYKASVSLTALFIKGLDIYLSLKEYPKLFSLTGLNRI